VDLRRRYDALSSRLGPNLVSHLVEVERPELPGPWAAPKAPGNLATLLGHAEALSLLARGTTLQYHDMVSEERAAKRLPAGDSDLGDTFAGWWSAARDRLRSWDDEELLRIPEVATSVRPGDAEFLGGWLRRLQAHRSAAGLFGDKAARRLVYEREVLKKPTKARLKHLQHLKSWNLPGGLEHPYQLDYRHGIGSSFAASILAGLSRRR